MSTRTATARSYTLPPAIRTRHQVAETGMVDAIVGLIGRNPWVLLTIFGLAAGAWLVDKTGQLIETASDDITSHLTANISE